MYIDSSIEYTFKVNKRTDPIKICPLNTDNYYITWDKFQEVFLAIIYLFYVYKMYISLLSSMGT